MAVEAVRDTIRPGTLSRACADGVASPTPRPGNGHGVGSQCDQPVRVLHGRACASFAADASALPFASVVHRRR